MCSSTTREMLNLRIWGEIKKYFKLAKKADPRLPGNFTESRFAITTDGKDVEARDFRNGIIGRPCIANGRFVGLGDYAGVKNYRVIMIADEGQFMPPGFLNSMANLDANPKHQLFVMGNPKDPTDSLGKACEPHKDEGGWEGIDRSEKTKTWRTRIPGGICIQLVGTDSPNFDYPEGEEPYPWMIGREKINKDIAYRGRESLEFAMFDLGMMPVAGILQRVITRNLCEKFFAMEPPDWDASSQIIKIFALDAGYGGDRCVGGEFHLGRTPDNHQIVAFIGSPVIIPVSATRKEDVEDQIAGAVMVECQHRGISPENVFFDSTGRGVLGNSFARIWSQMVNPVSFEGQPTDRQTSDGRKSKECFRKFVSELWFSARWAIEAGQVRNMPESVMLEGCMRKFETLPGGKKDVETKDDTRTRMGISPDLFDMFVIGIEGARQRGFIIQNLGKVTIAKRLDWLYRRSQKSEIIIRNQQLQTA